MMGEKKKQNFPAYNKLFPMISDNMTFLGDREQEEGTQIKKNISQNLV